MIALVTGATGFVGMRLCARLMEGGHTVKAALRPGGNSANGAALADMGAKTMPVDLSDPQAVLTALDGVDTLYHLAWKSNRMSRGAAHQGVQSPATENLAALQTLIDGAKKAGIRRIVFASTVSVYGPETEWGPIPQTESGALPELDGHPNPYFRFYAAAKAEAERMLRTSAGPVETVIIRPAMVYGANAQFATQMVTNAVNGNGAGNAPHPVQWVHVDDVSRALVLAGEREEAANQTFNIAGRKAILNHTLANEVRRLATAGFNGGQGDILDWNARVPRYDIRAAKTKLAFHPQIGWRDGLKEMVAAEA